MEGSGVSFENEFEEQPTKHHRPQTTFRHAHASKKNEVNQNESDWIQAGSHIR